MMSPLKYFAAGARQVSSLMLSIAGRLPNYVAAHACRLA